MGNKQYKFSWLGLDDNGNVEDECGFDFNTEKEFAEFAINDTPHRASNLCLEVRNKEGVFEAIAPEWMKVFCTAVSAKIYWIIREGVEEYGADYVIEKKLNPYSQEHGDHKAFINFIDAHLINGGSIVDVFEDDVIDDIVEACEDEASQMTAGQWLAADRGGGWQNDTTTTRYTNRIAA